MPIKIMLNGKEEKLSDGVGVGALLSARNIRREVVVVELNGDIVKREDYDSVLLKEGDYVELVYYMGGGIMANMGQSQGLSGHGQDRGDDESKGGRNG